MKKKRRAIWFGVGAGVGAALGIVSLVLVAGSAGGGGSDMPRSPMDVFPTRAEAPGAPPVRMASSDDSVMMSSDESGGGVPGASTEGSEGMGEGGVSPSFSGEESYAPDMSPQPCDFPQFIGKAVDESALKAIGRPFRILPPGGMATMDFSPARINLETDDKGIVTRIHCG